MKEQITHNKTVLVIGGGHYGAKACRFFREQKTRVLLVDNDPGCKAKTLVATEDFILKDSRDAIEPALNLNPDFIVPTQPGHTLGKWIGGHFNLKPLTGAIPAVTRRLSQNLLLYCDETNAALIFSYMAGGKLCREDCLPGHNKCSLTGEPRPAPLYKLMEYAIFELFDCAKIFVSEQMAPGVGAIKTSEFLAFVDEINAKKPKTLAVGTACQCHGVLNLFKR